MQTTDCPTLPITGTGDVAWLIVAALGLLALGTLALVLARPRHPGVPGGGGGVASVGLTVVGLLAVSAALVTAALAPSAPALAQTGAASGAGAGAGAGAVRAVSGAGAPAVAVAGVAAQDPADCVAPPLPTPTQLPTPSPTPSPSPTSTPTLSDRRRKRRIRHLLTTPEGIRLYSFQYRGVDETTYVGVMAQDLLGTAHADAVSLGPDGYYRVDYDRLGLRMVAWEQWQHVPVG